VATLTQLGENIEKTKILDKGFISCWMNHDKVRFVSKNVQSEALKTR